MGHGIRTIKNNIEHLTLYEYCSLNTAVYACFCFVFGLLGNITLHVMMVGLIVALFAWFRLPPPNPTLVRAILGEQPRPGKNDASVGRQWKLIASCEQG